MKYFFPFICLVAPLCAVDQSILSYTTIQDQYTVPILTPSLAKRKTEKLILENGLKILLISDTETPQSSAGICVGAGSWNDDYPGIAHFLEHMLFMGTKAYPDESEYMQFIKDHGGKVNAYTAPDRTVYMFSIHNDAYPQAIDRFSHFFIDPLFSTSCRQRELNAVDNEHAKNIEHDGWRQYMILKETGNPNHPNCKFSTGNKDTLCEISQSDLKNWYANHYNANCMHLVMISPLPIAEMRDLVVTKFSPITNTSFQKKTSQSSLLSEQQKGSMIFIKPVKDLKTLSLCWEIPSVFASNIEEKVPEFIAYILNKEVKGSLFAKLKKENIAENFHVSCDRFSKDNLLFCVDVSLTDFGLLQIDSAISYIFAALERLKIEKLPDYLFQEFKTMAIIDYQYQSREDAFEMASEIASDMLYEDLSSYPIKTKIPSVFSPQRIHSFLNTLNSSECVYFVIADPSKVGVIPDRKEKWMEAEYTVIPIDQKKLQAWQKPEVYPEINLPGQNPYLPTQLTLQSTSLQEIPILIHQDEGSEVYFLSDNYYRTPETVFTFQLKSPLLDQTPKAQVLADLWSYALQDLLADDLSFAKDAGIQIELKLKPLEAILYIQGLSEKMSLLTKKVFQAFKQVTCSQEKFQTYVSSLAASYENASKELPLCQAAEQMREIVFDQPTSQQKLLALQKTCLKDVCDFSEKFSQCLYMQALLYGNLNQELAIQLSKELQTILAAKPYSLQSQAKAKVLLLSDLHGPYKLVFETNRQGAAALLLLQEGPFSFESWATQQILGQALKSAFYETLRTKQQTAYIAKTWDDEKEKQLLQYFAVQSSTHTPADLLARFELFLEDFDRNLPMEIPLERFEKIRTSLITSLAMRSENMFIKAIETAKLAFYYQDFEWINKQMDSLKTLSYSNFCTAAQRLISRKNTRRLAILVEGIMTDDKNFRYELTSKEDVQALGQLTSVN
ncbi:insulinase family protein [Candidatus Rhabdochlamydia porcellionis]|jgi:insulysin|uniref:Protease 3 n=1 Tax=Candidatus Rhabdochlamydia porcellionis TaxID=225148 RepID=A0ABX8Z117_9BACT|nr:insulinase family protein [Candidatus Rhabdochlamydia porcellionis]QZA59128.1 Protease 3 [Candidatus Rhabdochlamydia porcellionis]